MIKYLQGLHMQAVAPELVEPKSLVYLLAKNLGKPQPSRSHKVVHASDVTKDIWCSRRIRLMDVHEVSYGPETFHPALKATFDVGRMTGDLVANHWAGEAAVGNWECTSCGVERVFTTKPGVGCAAMGRCNWQYREVVFRHLDTKLSGSVDLFVQLQPPPAKATLVELKIVRPEDFSTLASPLWEHKLRTAMYLRLVAESNNPVRSLINTQVGKILYVSRGHGKKDPETGMILPFREFNVVRDDEATQPYFDRAGEVHIARVTNTIPDKKICESPTCNMAKACPVRAQCWS